MGKCSIRESPPFEIQYMIRPTNRLGRRQHVAQAYSIGEGPGTIVCQASRELTAYKVHADLMQSIFAVRPSTYDMLRKAPKELSAAGAKRAFGMCLVNIAIMNRLSAWDRYAT